MVEKRLKCTMSQDALNFRLLAQQFLQQRAHGYENIVGQFPASSQPRDAGHARNPIGSALVRELAADLAVVRLPRFSNATNPPSFLRGERTCLLNRTWRKGPAKGPSLWDCVSTDRTCPQPPFIPASSLPPETSRRKLGWKECIVKSIA